MSPPPPTGTTIVSTSGTASTISRPTVPWPAMIARVVERGHERGAGVGRELERGRERAGVVGAGEHDLAPWTSVCVILVNGVSAGMTIVAGIPSRCAW